MFIDKSDGSLILADGTKLRVGASASNLQSHAFDIHKSNGALQKRYTSLSHAIGNHPAWLSVSVYSGQIKEITFGFTDLEDDPKLQQSFYSGFLKEEIGQPTESRFNGQLIMYQFSWGDIEASYDPRNGTSSITVVPQRT